MDIHTIYVHLRYIADNDNVPWWEREEEPEVECFEPDDPECEEEWR